MAKDEDTEVETVEAGDAPLLDLNDATVKKMIARAKKRGVITVDTALGRSSRPEQLFGLLERAGFDVSSEQQDSVPSLRVAEA